MTTVPWINFASLTLSLILPDLLALPAVVQAHSLCFKVKVRLLERLQCRCINSVAASFAVFVSRASLTAFFMASHLP
jgi:hypothetical protein